jgi:hypothetical protein
MLSLYLLTITLCLAVPGDVCDYDPEPTLYFATFADSKYKQTRERICQQAKGTGVFQDTFCYGEDDLDSEFWEEHCFFITTNSRGFGYWIWKPQIILQVLSSIPDGAVLVYADAGSTLNAKHTYRLYHYAALASISPVKIAAFSEDWHKIITWTKADMVKHYELTDEELEMRQIAATSLIIVNSPESRSFIQRWSTDTVRDEYRLVDDSKSKVPESPGFIEHRHDQSVFSIMGRREGVATLRVWELIGDQYPIKATRMRF